MMLAVAVLRLDFYEGKVNLSQHVTIVGLGGLGCPAAWTLAQAGVSRLTLVDPDLVEQSNLHRQVLHHEADLGTPKVLSAQAKLLQAFPLLHIEALQVRVTAENVGLLVAQSDVVIDAVDGMDSKLLLSDAAVLHRTCLIYGGALRWSGQAMRIDPAGPCLRCLFADASDDDGPTCAQAGVMGPVVGFMGALQAELVLNRFNEPAPVLGESRLFVFDGLEMKMRMVRVKKDPKCSVCGVP